MGKLYVGDVGTEIIIDCGEDITSAATAPIIAVKKPDNTTDQWTGEVYESNKVRYVTQAGDIDQVGIYRLQVKLELDTWEGSGESVTIQAYNLFG